MVARLQSLKPLVGGDELAHWQALADEGRVDELFERLMTQHYDPAYLRSTTREFGPGDAANRLALESVRPDALAATARRLIASGAAE
jgi:tRNA 2-selenouridine synthase